MVAIEEQGRENVLKGWIVALVAFVAMPAVAATVTDTTSCRAAPSTTARTVLQLRAGQAVGIKSRVPGWVEVDRTVNGCWVSGDMISGGAAGYTGVNIGRTSSYRTSGANSYRAAHPKTPRKSFASTSHRSSRSLYTSALRASRQSTYRSHRSYGSYGGSCPCSGGSVCIGPRGGRYCITSGGNKRYGV